MRKLILMLILNFLVVGYNMAGDVVIFDEVTNRVKPGGYKHSINTPDYDGRTDVVIIRSTSVIAARPFQVGSFHE